MSRTNILGAFATLVLAGWLQPTAAQTSDGYIGIYADSTGTTPCATIPPLESRTMYVIAKLEGASAGGISGAEFRIEVENPSGWFFMYEPPPADIKLGQVLDLDPENPDDGSGLSIAFGSCLPPSNGMVSLGKLFAFNSSGSPTQLLVRRHSSPTNADYPCPLFTLCDDPVFSKSCMTPSSEPPCSTGGP